MRIVICVLTMVSAAFPASPSHRAEGPREGVKTPGIQIPFSSLKPEASLPAPDQPGWIFYSRELFIPAKGHIDRIEVKTNKAGDSIAGIAKPCGGMVSAFGSLWTPSCADGALLRIDPKTAKITATIASGADDVAGSIAATADSVWFLTDSKTTLSRIDPDQNAVVGEMRLPAGCTSLSFGETALWLACPAANKVLRINPETNLVEKEIAVSAQPEAITVGANSIWVLCAKDGKVDRVDPKTNQVTKSIELDVPEAKGAIAFGEGFVWVTVKGFPLTRIDPQADSVAQQFFGTGGGGAIATSPGAVWLADGMGAVLRIDPKRVLATLAE
jgi:streptogramin lyase